MTKLSRRSFLKTGMMGAAGLALPVRSWSRVIGANDEIRIAVIGFNSRGGDHIKGYTNIADKQKGKVRVVALCDVDTAVLAKGVRQFEGRNEKVETYQDLRKLFENKDIDAVSIATPNHWHSLAAIWAMQAGKDVYVEKPVCHNVFEGRKMIDAARKYERIVQAGTQSRSSLEGIGAAVKWVREGNLGKIIAAKGYCYKPRPSIGKTVGEQVVASTIDYDLWCGPAKKLPLTRAHLHYDWHWVWNTGNGDVGNQGIHQMDISRWFLGETDLSPRVFALGGRLGYEDDGETPNTELIYHDYERAPLIFEVRGLPTKKGARDMDKIKGGTGVSVVIECEKGYVYVPDYTQATAFDKDDVKIQSWRGAVDHYGNFLDAVRSRKVSDLHADIQEGFVSSALCHTGNISYRVGKTKSPDEIKEAIKGDKEALPCFEKMKAHLEANEVDLDKTKATLGRVLKMNLATGKFNGDEEANALLTRDYRPGFVVPEKV